MDDTERKIFVQLDDDMPAQRANALEMLREHMKKKTPPRFFRDIAQEDETAGATIAALQAQVAQEQQLNAQNQQNFTQQYGKLQADYVRLKRLVDPVLWAQKHWRRLALAAAVPLLAASVWLCWPAETAVHREAVDDSFNALAAATPWHPGGDLRPVVRMADGQSYWVTARFDANAAHYNADGEPVLVQCVHLFAAPAAADAGVYLEPHPYSLFGFGWLTWPERGVSCKSRASGNNAAQAMPPLSQSAAPHLAAGLVSSAEAAPPSMDANNSGNDDATVPRAKYSPLGGKAEIPDTAGEKPALPIHDQVLPVALQHNERARTQPPGCPLWGGSEGYPLSGILVSPDSTNCAAVVRLESILNLYEHKSSPSVSKNTVVKVIGKASLPWLRCDDACHNINDVLLNVRLPNGTVGYLSAMSLKPY